MSKKQTTLYRFELPHETPKAVQSTFCKGVFEATQVKCT